MLSVIIIAKNEALHIKRCLESVAFADEIIVLDSGSSDNTVEIAKAYTDKVFVTDWPGYGLQKERALQLATHPWVLSIDADEAVSQRLRDAMFSAIRSDKYGAYQIPIKLLFNGQLLKYSWSPKHHIRLFKRDNAHFSDNVIHEQILLPKHVKVGGLKAPIIHHCVDDVTHALDKINRYSSLSAKERLSQNKTTSIPKAIGTSLWMFIRAYFIQFGILDGRAGYVFACLSAQAAFYRHIKMIYQDSASG